MANVGGTVTGRSRARTGDRGLVAAGWAFGANRVVSRRTQAEGPTNSAHVDDDSSCSTIEHIASLHTMNRTMFACSLSAAFIGGWMLGTYRRRNVEPIAPPASSLRSEPARAPAGTRDYTALAETIRRDMTMDQCELLLGGPPDSRWRKPPHQLEPEHVSMLAGAEVTDVISKMLDERPAYDLAISLNAPWIPVDQDANPVPCLEFGANRPTYKAQEILDTQVSILAIDLQLRAEYRSESALLERMTSRPLWRNAARWGPLTIFFSETGRVRDTFLLPAEADVQHASEFRR